jgi:hypothetical protein
MANHLAHAGIIAELLAYQQKRFRALGGHEHQGNLLGRDAERLFANDGFNGFETGSGHLRKQVARGGDLDGVDILEIEHLPPFSD